MKKHFLVLSAIALAALVFELMPFGVTLHFAEAGGSTVVRTYSYFSLTPWGYAAFAPFFTACLTALLLTVAAIGCFTEKRLLLTTAIISAIATPISLLPFLDNSFSWVTAIVSLLLCVAAVYGFFGYKKLTEPQ